jgi:hypothetical protein
MTNCVISVYSLFSALIMHVYQMRSSNRSVVSVTEERLQICMNALKEVSKVWLVAKMVHTLFESILGNKVLEERLQKAAGKRHKSKHHGPLPKGEPSKRKYDDMDITFPNGLPAQQVSYERSRPQSPDAVPKEMTGQNVTSTSPQARQVSDTFMASSREDTRPTTPFALGYSFPGTPPDLFLHTRNSPNISEALWQNFQPDQLFPAESNVSIPQFPTNQQGAYIDPQLSRQQQTLPMHLHSPNMHSPQGQQAAQGQNQYFQPNDLGAMNPTLQQAQQGAPSAWDQLGAMTDATGNEDTWSNSSTSQGGPIVPTTLNVEDWYVKTGLQKASILTLVCWSIVY